MSTANFSAAASPIASTKAQPLSLDPVASEYARNQGSRCAIYTWSAAQIAVIFILLELLLYVALYDAHLLAAIVFSCIAGALLFIASFRLLLIVLSLLDNPQATVSQQDIDLIDRATLPPYTILVPLYKESKIASGIVAALGKLDYPRHLLDIKLILEADDDTTIAAINAISLSPEFHVIMLPPSLPRTKPKACNHGLLSARGEYVVIFDAEDRPDFDQLLKAVAVFRSRSFEFDCAQAKLNFYNPRDNFLTRSFTIEYTIWFDLVLPGIQRLKGPIPLGGTSNHFRTANLRKLGGWDPFNVTEDCDLGVRLATAGCSTTLLDSTTWEEANGALGNWLRQRSRWSKGYMQTHLVHTRNPISLVQSLGVKSTALLFLCVSSVPFQHIMNGVCLPMTFTYGVLLFADVIDGRSVWTVIAGSPDEYRIAWKLLYLENGNALGWALFSLAGFLASVAMLLANFLFILIALIACRQRRNRDLWTTALASPIYWLLASVASWKGFVQLVTRPHYWEKTTHGQSIVEPLEHACVTSDSQQVEVRKSRS